MRVAVVSRIFSPEPSAASFRLGALAEALHDAGHEVHVLTVRPAKKFKNELFRPPYKVKRFPVLRDKTGYVRGYLQYMSFDVPLFFSILFSKGFDGIIVEPPPTTGFFVRLVASVRRIPYFYYAADIWSDASSQTGAPTFVVNIVKFLEKKSLNGAKLIFSVSEGVTENLNKFKISQKVVTVGNGIDLEPFKDSTLNQKATTIEQYFLYAGTASELHGAKIFIEALPHVLEQLPNAKILFVGGGVELDRLKGLAMQLGVEDSVFFETSVSQIKVNLYLKKAVAALASVRPGFGYDFAFPTKLYAAAASGCFSIFSGAGPGALFVENNYNGVKLGQAVDYKVSDVARAMVDSVKNQECSTEKQVYRSEWAQNHISIKLPANKIVKEIENFYS